MGLYGLLAVGFGAAMGAWLRWWLDILLNPLFPTLPFGTLAANLIGAYLVGVAVAIFAEHAGLPPEFGSEVETEAVIEGSRRHYAHQLQPLKTQVGSLTARFEVIVGHPAESIVLYAEDHGIDHIVVGHRGHSLFERWLLGSVARQVIAYAPCSVTVVRVRVSISVCTNRHIAAICYGYFA